MRYPPPRPDRLTVRARRSVPGGTLLSASTSKLVRELQQRKYDFSPAAAARKVDPYSAVNGIVERLEVR